MKIKKLYLVKREVIATNLKQALTAPGTVYEVSLSEEKNWPQPKKTKPLGFKKQNDR